MTVTQGISTPVYPEHLLETIQQQLTLSCRLSIHCLENPSEENVPIHETCGTAQHEPPCEEGCRRRLHEAVFRAIEEQKPAVFRCPEGILNFAAPFWDERNRICCILGAGIRENSPAEPSANPVERFREADSSKDATGLEDGDLQPSADLEEVESAAETVQEILLSVLKKNPYAQTLEKSTGQLRTLTDVTAEIEQCRDSEQVSALIAEFLVVLFNLSAVIVLLVDETGADFFVKKALGQAPEEFNQGAIRKVLNENPPGRVVPIDDARSLFPGERKRPALCLSLVDGERHLGLLALFGGSFLARDQLLIELLTGRAAAKLGRLAWEDQSRIEKGRQERLVEMICTLSLVKTRQELFRQTVDLAADLLRASRGSLMLVDVTGENLVMVAARGMSESLAKNMTVRIGTSIAGRVANNGTPLLVANIEKDRRIATSNRPRFKTKSFLSVPLALRDKTIGVLNLADKEGENPFNQTDLDLLMTFAKHVASMTERAEIFENADQMEELAMTDPLTGIYNRRFLERRLDEELSRSSRHKLEFTVILLDLDHFKRYNDLVGHLGGDRALQKSAELLLHSARDMDIVTRFGGEEFCIVLPATSKRESIFVADRIRRAIENEPFPQEKNLPSENLTVSIGVATFPKDGDTAEVLLQSADRALYHAKETGRNRIVLSEPPTSVKFGRQLG